MFSLQQLSAGWHWFFHAPEPVASLCLFRVVFGLLLVINALLLIEDAQVLLGPRGIFPYADFTRLYRRGRMTLFDALPDTPAVVGWIVMVHLAASVGVMIGLWTNVSAIVAWIMLVSLHHRSPGSFHGGDTVMRLMLFHLCFTPSGYALSCDAYLAGRDPIAAMNAAPGSLWAMRLMQVQVSIIYLWTTHWKLRGRMWREGTAVFYAIGNKSFQRGRLPNFMLRPLPMKLATCASLIVEGSLGTLIWVREFRHPLVLAGLALHLGIEYCMNLQLFGWTMCCCLLLFLNPTDVASWIEFAFG